MREPLLSKLLRGYDLSWSPTQKNKFLTKILQLRIPATEERMFSDEPVCRAAQISPRAPLL